MKYGCIGEHLSHSFSREIHHRLDSRPYVLCEIAPGELSGFLKKRDFFGINVTIPYKKDVIPYLDSISPEAKEIGAVNTICNKSGSLSGYNTDYSGMRALFGHAGINPENKKVLILGTGGTSRTALAVAKSLGAREAIRVSRTAKDDAISYEEAMQNHSDTEILINTTPCGMFPRAGVAPIELDAFPKLCGVIDAIYNPLRSQLVLEAMKRGIPASGGLFMLVMQGIFASEIFTGKSYPANTGDRIYSEILREKENIVLTGMPASGKSTIGRALAERMGRAFFDSDAEIERMAGKSIREIFAESGEAAFREAESEVLRTLSAKSGVVLATGGGAVLREENVDFLRSGGRIYFLNRPLDQLIPTDSRPLASTKEAIGKRFSERRERYFSTSDAVVPVSGIVEEAVEYIIKEFDRT